MAVLTSTGITFSDATSQATRASTAADVQTLLATGTWTKPTGGQTMARIQLWGGGGGAGRANVQDMSGGGGGGYNEVTVPISQINTQTITIGAGGTGRTGSTGVGTSGGNTTMTVNGATLGAYGGGGGSSTQNIAAGGGGPTGAGGTANGVAGTPLIGSVMLVESTTGLDYLSTSGGTDSQILAAVGIFHGGAGGFNPPNPRQRAGMGSIYGGGGGCVGTAGTTNNSIFGGRGGLSGGAGVQPGGGGSSTGVINTNGGDGAAGKAVITCW